MMTASLALLFVMFALPTPALDATGQYISGMASPTRAQQLAWMAQWRSAAVELERVRLNELASADLARVAADLEDVSIVAARARGRECTSGLVEQQRLFQRRAPR